MNDQKISAEKIKDARNLLNGAFVNPVSSGRKARCRECNQLIETGERITFATPYLPWPVTLAHLHADAAVCAENLARRTFKIAKPKPTVEPNVRSSWTLPADFLEEAHQTSIHDCRLPRKRVTCRLCGGVIELYQARRVFKLRDFRGWSIRDAEGREIGDGFLHNDMGDCKDYEEYLEMMAGPERAVTTSKSGSESH